jgi:uncharacterized protein (DUF58 family)
VSYFDPKVLARVKKLSLRARYVVDGLMVGVHSSRAKGLSPEFEEHRGYAQGDDARHIDWKAYAKFDRFFVKQYLRTTNVRAHLVLDSSGSMGYASDGMSKFDYACTLAASLVYLMLSQQDAAGLIIFSEKIDTMIPPKTSRDHLHAVLKALEDARPKGETSTASVLGDLAATLKRRGLVILISDLLDEPEGVLKGLKQLRARGNEVIVFHVMDPDELVFPFREPSLFQDMEGDLRLPADPQAVRSAYLAALRSHIEVYRRACYSHRIDYVSFDTSDGLDRSLAKYLTWRRKLKVR